MSHYNLQQNSGTLPLGRCPHCGIAVPRLQRLLGNTTNTTDSQLRNERRWMLFACSTCGGCVMGAWTGQTNLIEIWPDHGDFSADIPAMPLDYLKQAVETINSPRASVLMSAGAVDATLKARGLTEGSLYKRIDDAVTQGIITAEMAEWAHDVRLDANDQRHADLAAVAPDSEDAKRCLDFARALAEIIFVLPARVKRGKTSAAEAIAQKKA